MTEAKHGYEIHITIEPVFGERLDIFNDICLFYNYKVAKLLMQKDREATEERSDKDSFCTGHRSTYEEAMESCMNLKQSLLNYGFKVWRCKIEAIVYDEKFERAKSA